MSDFTISITRNYRNVPDNAKKSAALLSSLQGCRKCEIIENTDSTDRKVRASFDVVTDRLFDDLKEVFAMHPDDEPMTLPFDEPVDPGLHVGSTPEIEVTQDDIQRAVAVWEDEGRINAILLAKHTEWTKRKAVHVIAAAKSQGAIPQDAKA